MDKEVVKRIISIITTTLFLVVSTFLWLETNTKNNIVIDRYYKQANNLEFVELSEAITMHNAYPVKDEVGLKGDRYTFQIKNNDITPKEVVVKFEEVETSSKKLPYKNIRFQIYKNNEIFISATNLSDDGIIFSDVVEDSTIYSLIMWIDYDSTNEIMGTRFNSKITLI